MKVVLFTLLSLIASCSFANDMEKLGNQLNNFYLEPTKEKFIDFQLTANKFETELTSSRNSSDILVALMTARISEKYKWPIEDTFFDEQAKEILEGKSELAQFINNDDLVSPAKLDMWWASYFATGDETYLHKLLKYAGEDLPKGDTAKLMVVGAATWSFKSNCKQHQSIRDFAQKMSQDNSLSSKKREFLIETVKFVDGQGS